MPKKKPKDENTKPIIMKKPYKTIKTSLKSILLPINALATKTFINNLCIKCNDIVIETYQFIRLFCLKNYHNNLPIPELSEKFISYCMKTLGIRDNRGKKSKEPILSKLQTFYDEEFKQLQAHPEKFDIKCMTHLFSYLSTQIHTGIHNNIKIHFCTRLSRFINKTVTIYESDLTKEQAKKERIVLKKAIYENTPPPERYKVWYDSYRTKILPETWTNCIAYDVKVSPEKYLPYSFFMNNVLEEKGCKLFQPLSLRNSIIPHYITLDTASIVNVFSMKGKGVLLSNITENQKEIWENFFNLNHKIFKQKDYNFNYTIQTDGIGVSLLFVHKNHIKFGESSCSNKDALTYKYIEECTKDKLESLKTKKIVGADPGKFSLIYMTDGKNKLRYNAFQRHTETYAMRNSQIMLSEKTKNRIIEKETSLSEKNCKTVNYEKFKEYLKIKNKLNAELKSFYIRELFRKMKWRRFVYTQKSESRFLNNIQKIFGKPEDVVIAYGDWSRSSQMNNFMSTPGKGIRKLITQKYETISINEFRTSKLCCKCYKELDHYKKEANQVYRCLICKECGSSPSKLSRFVTRDLNAAQNILNLCELWIKEQKRPEAFQRKVEGQAPTPSKDGGTECLSH